MECQLKQCVMWLIYHWLLQTSLCNFCWKDLCAGFFSEMMIACMHAWVCCAEQSKGPGERDRTVVGVPGAWYYIRHSVWNQTESPGQVQVGCALLLLSRSPMPRDSFEGKGHSIVKYRESLPWAVWKQLTQSKCRLGCWVGLAQGSMY